MDNGGKKNFKKIAKRLTLSFLLVLFACAYLMLHVAYIVDASCIGRNSKRLQHLQLGFLQNWMVSVIILLQSNLDKNKQTENFEILEEKL